MPICLKTVLLPLLSSLLGFFLRYVFDADDPPARHVRLTAVILAAAVAAAAIGDKFSPLRVVHPRVRDGRLVKSLLSGPDAGALWGRVRLSLVSLTAGPPIDGAGRDKGGGA